MDCVDQGCPKAVVAPARGKIRSSGKVLLAVYVKLFGAWIGSTSHSER